MHQQPLRSNAILREWIYQALGKIDMNRPKYWLMIVAVAAVTLVNGCEGRIVMERRDLSSPVKYRLNGVLYEIPLGYHFYAYLKRNQWPTPKPDYSDVDAVEWTALLPTLTPYTSENAVSFSAPGPGSRVHVLMQNADLVRPRSTPDYLQFLEESGRLTKLDDAHGLQHYHDSERSPDPEQGADLYVTGEQEPLRILCDRAVEYPTCKVIKMLPDDVYLTYHYSAQYLSSWKEIDARVKRKIAEFKQ